MRLLTLHVRGRRGGPIAGALLGVASAGWVIAAYVPDAGMLVAVLAPLAAVSVIGFALGGDDPTLEGTTPQWWERWRAIELAVCAGFAVAAVAPTLLEADQHAPAILRNLAGFGGLTALGATVLGARLAWVAPAASALLGGAVGPRGEHWLAPLTWPGLAGDSDSALTLAAALAVAGAGLYTWCGRLALSES